MRLTYGTILCRNVHGKLCFGYEEMGNLQMAYKHGQIALDHTPNDIWSIHAMSHVFDSKLR